MDEEKVKRVILDSKEEIESAVTRTDDCKDYLSNELGKTQSYINQYYDVWKYAFDNVSDWERVKEKFSSTNSKMETKAIQSTVINTQTFVTPQQEISTLILKHQNRNIPKIKTKIQTKNNKIDYQVIKEAYIIIEFLSKNVYGNLIFI